MGAFLRHGRRHQKVEGGQISAEEDIKKLREARYLTAEILHRLPPRGQAVPTPEPNESVVFVSHFLRGLGLALDPFVRGLMFYYGLNFHDLAPDSFLHITTSIVVCEAFLRVTPHFGLWLKTFEVKPKLDEGQHAARGGASIRKMTGAAWPKGSIPEVSGLWQQEWFYITAPRSAKWAATPVFRPGPPPQLMSWNRRDSASAACSRAGHPLPRTQRDRRVRLSLPPRSRPCSGSFRQGFDVLLRARFP